MDWQTIINTPHATVPASEWWYSLSPGLSDSDYTNRIKAAEAAFAARFGYPPDAIPRVVFIGATPVLAYPCPCRSHDEPEPEPEPDAWDPAIEQLHLLPIDDQVALYMHAAARGVAL